VRLSADG